MILGVGIKRDMIILKIAIKPIYVEHCFEFYY